MKYVVIYCCPVSGEGWIVADSFQEAIDELKTKLGPTYEDAIYSVFESKLVRSKG